MSDNNVDTAAHIEALMDDNGFLPSDADFKEPVVVEDEPQDAPQGDVDEPQDEPQDDVDEPEDDEPTDDLGDEVDEPEDEPEGLSDDTLLDIDIGEDTYEVNLAELKAGYLRNEDFTTRMSALQAEHDEKMAEMEVKQAELVRELEIASVIATGDLSRYDQIDWNRLKAEDPARYNELRLEALDAREQAQNLVNRRNTIAGLDAKAKQLKHEAYVKSQMAIAERLVPELKDEGERNKTLQYALSIGFSKEDIMGIADAKTLLILNNSRKYAESQVRKKDALEKKVSKELPPAIKPGAPKTKATADKLAVRKTASRVRSEQSVEAAAAHFLNVVNFD